MSWPLAETVRLLEAAAGSGFDWRLTTEIIIGLLAAVLTLIAFLSAARANRASDAATTASAQAATVQVDAEAYVRAKGLYESAIRAIEGQSADLHRQITDLQNEVSRLRSQSGDLTAEVIRLRDANTELQRQIRSMKSP